MRLDGQMRWPVSVKGVVLDEDGRVLLGRNDRDEWELLGGRLESGESPDEAVRREIREEAGLDVRPVLLLRTWVFDPVPGSSVLIGTFGCELRGGTLVASSEHSCVRFHEPRAVAALPLPEGYRTDIGLWRGARDSRPQNG